MTQLISHWFCTLDLNNQTFQRKFLEDVAFTLLYKVLGAGMMIVYMSFCAWYVYLTSGHEQEPESALRRDRWFSHMDNSLWLHWGARMHSNTQCTVHWAKWWALSMTSHSAVQLAAAVYVTLIVDPHGRPSGCQNYAPHFKSKGNISNEHFLDCKQYSIHFIWIHTLLAQQWCDPRVEHVVLLVVFPPALRSYLWGPLEGSLSNGSTWPWPVEVT